MIQVSKSGLSSDLPLIKSSLAEFNHFFDGRFQRDAFECFSNVIDILHTGTSKSLIDHDFLDDDECITSLKIDLFTFIKRNMLTCSICGNSSITFEPCTSIDIYPETCKSIFDLIHMSLQGNIHKLCNICLVYTNHLESSSFEQCPYFIRFDQKV